MVFDDDVITIDLVFDDDVVAVDLTFDDVVVDFAFDDDVIAEGFTIDDDVIAADFTYFEDDVIATADEEVAGTDLTACVRGCRSEDVLVCKALPTASAAEDTDEP